MDKSSTFQSRYDALDNRRKGRLLALMNEWGIGNSTTSRTKISGKNLKRIEVVAIDGMLTMIEKENAIANEGKQLSINFSWDADSEELTFRVQ